MRRSTRRVMALGLGAAAYEAVRRLGELDLAGKAVLITGGSRGLGLEVARAFAARGAQLALVARDEAELATARQELIERGARAEVFPCDVTFEHEAKSTVRKAIETFGGLDVVVNVAGLIEVGPVETLSLDDLHAALDVNFWGMVNVTLAAVEHMKLHGGGRIVNVTSIGGEVAVPHLLPYSVSKFAAVGFSTGIASELAKDDIRVTTVVPGLMRTGSPGQALVKGQLEPEYAWFAVGDSLPILSMSAHRAAKRIVQACARGERYVVLGMPAKVLRLASALFPSAVAMAMELTARLLPGAGRAGPEQKAEKGFRHGEGIPKPLTALSEEAAERNNEVPPVVH